MDRGDIYWVNLDPTIGSEIRKQSSCVLLGATPINKVSRTVVVVPLSSSPKSHPPVTVSVKCLGRQGVAVCDQIRTVDKQRLIKKAGELSTQDLNNIENGLRQVLVL